MNDKCGKNISVVYKTPIGKPIDIEKAKLNLKIRGVKIIFIKHLLVIENQPLIIETK